MKNTITPTEPSENSLFEDYIIDYFYGRISPENLSNLSELIKSDETYKLKFEEALQLHAYLFVPEIEASKRSNLNYLLEQIKEKPSFKIESNWFTPLNKIAAIIVLTLISSLSFFYVYNHLITKDDLVCFETSVPVGSKSRILLPDSTVAWLNSGSTLKYHQSFGKESRTVELSGEGYFEVTKDKSKPFLVHTKSLDIKVLGTVFNINSYLEDEEVDVTLIEGSVNVSIPENKEAGSRIMFPNERLTYNKKTKKVISTEIDANKSKLWTTGVSYFTNATLESISKDLERKYGIKIRIESHKIKDELFTGSLNLNQPIKDVISFIDVDKKFILKQTNDTLVISSRY